MSATNRTENYNLPIFIETDKPAWLVDFNGAMRSIDAQMKLNAEAIATKSPILTFQDTADIDFTKTGDIVTANLQSAITDKVGRALVTPLAAPTEEQIVAINTNGVQDALNIGTGLYNNSGNLEAVDLNLTAAETSYTINNASSTGKLTVATNADKTIGKIYGNLPFTNAQSGRAITITTAAGIVAAPDERYEIYPAGLCVSGAVSAITGISVFVETTGALTIQFTPQSTYGFAFILPCLYFFKDFGDVS